MSIERLLSVSTDYENRHGYTQKSVALVLVLTLSMNMLWNGISWAVRNKHIISRHFPARPDAVLGEAEFLDVFQEAYASAMRYMRAPDGFWVSSFDCSNDLRLPTAVSECEYVHGMDIRIQYWIAQHS